MTPTEAAQTIETGNETRRRLLLLPVAFIAALVCLTALPSVHQNARVLGAFLGAAGLLLLWTAILFRRARPLTLQLAAKKQHYIQACAQGAALVYWGLYWHPVYAFAPFIVAQLFFAYAFDALLSWSRRSSYILGFAPFPVIFSINLFLWFRPDWFFLQFLMIAIGLLAKEMIRWTRDGRRVHIFNPSSFPLAVFSLLLLATGASGITFGQDIATTQFFPPQMYLALFLIGLPGQFFFGVTSMTMSAVITTWLFGRLYFAATGVYFFYDSYIPIAVFLGMNLLFNDPTTSPRSELGRIAHGALYGLSTVALYSLLGHAGMPTFYDKLLQVPLLNLLVRALDAAARSRWLRWFDPATLGRTLAPYRRNLAYMSVWAIVFAGLSFAHDLSDRHPGQWIPFWQHACDEDRPYACPYLADMELNACHRGSGWACNEAGRMDIALSRSGEDLRRQNPATALEPFNRGCELGFPAACKNLYVMTHGGALSSAPPTLADYPIILRGSKGEIRDKSPSQLYDLAREEGWQVSTGQN